MKKFLALALVCVLASSANAAVLGLATPDGNLHGEMEPLELVVSQTAEIQIYLDQYDYTYLGSAPYAGYAELVYGTSIFLDTVDQGADPYHENMELIDVTRQGDADFIWNKRSFVGGEMGVLEFGPLPYDGGLDLEWYQLNATMNVPPEPSLDPLSNPQEGSYVPNRHILDTLVIHCTDVSVDTIWFEGAETFQAPASPIARPPTVYKDAGSGSLLITKDLGHAAWGVLGFDNGFILDTGVTKTSFARDGFWVVQTPEPASFALLALGGLALLRRRK